MEAELEGLPEPAWPVGFRALPWEDRLARAHAEVLAAAFTGSPDVLLFPSLGSIEGALGLLRDLSLRPNFLPRSTWIVEGPEGPCGSVQGVEERARLGAIQNLGVAPRWREVGLGKALLLQALRGMWEAGLERASLEVSASNGQALRLYQGLGFKRSRVLYKAASFQPAGGGEGGAIP
jgi:ribosomal protein S18 acetylase RimI-like enzyme